MKWLVGIAIVMGLTHLYFRRGERRLMERSAQEPGAQAESQTGQGASRPESPPHPPSVSAPPDA